MDPKMRLKWHAKWRDPFRKGVRSGLPARSSTLTPWGDAISMSFGFDRIAPHPRCERLENEPHFLRFRSLRRSNPPQTISASFIGPSPKDPDKAPFRWWAPSCGIEVRRKRRWALKTKKTSG